jgi:hypothetical protein
MFEALLAEDTEKFAGRMMVMVQAAWMVGFIVFQMVSLGGTLTGRIGAFVRCCWSSKPEVTVEGIPGEALPCPRCRCRCHSPQGWSWEELAEEDKAVRCGRCCCRVRVRRR